MTTNNRAFHLVFTLVATVLALVVLSAPSAYAESHTVDLNSFNGFYGYHTTSTGRNQTLTGSFPLEVLTSTTSINKDLYGIANNFTFSQIPSGGARYSLSFQFVLSQKYDTYYLDTPQSSKTATIKFADNSTTTVNCTVNYEYNDVDTYFVIFRCEYSGAKQPSTASATLGITSGFTVGTTSPIMWTPTINNKSIYVYSASYTYEVITNDQQGVIDELGNIDDTINDIHQDEKDTINDAVDDAHNAANSLNLNFSVINPIINWLALFRDDACVSIPTISSWLNTNETYICIPWRNTPVRGGLTPIFTLLGTMLVTAFVFRWLSSNNSEGTVEGV